MERTGLSLSWLRRPAAEVNSQVLRAYPQGRLSRAGAPRRQNGPWGCRWARSSPHASDRAADRRVDGAVGCVCQGCSLERSGRLSYASGSGIAAAMTGAARACRRSFRAVFVNDAWPDKLSAAEKDLLKRWVAQGAEYKSHWSFNPVENISPPKPRDAKRVRNPVDAFVLAKIAGEKLKPSSEASRDTLPRKQAFHDNLIDVSASFSPQY